MSSELLKIGVVGLGYWGPNLVRNFTQLDNCDLVAVCDLDGKRLHLLQKTYRHLLFTKDYDELVGNVDAVAVATPAGSHYSLGRKALEAGKSVFIEKPLTSSVVDGEKLMDLADQRRLTLMVDHTFIYHPAVREVKRVIDDNALGKLLYFESARQNWGLFPSDLNAIWDLAVHDVAILNHLSAQKPEAVVAIGDRFGRRPIEDRAYIHLFYPSGFRADINVSKLTPNKVRSLNIIGERKSIIYDDLLISEQVRVFDRTVDEELDVERQYAVRWGYKAGSIFSPNLPAEEALRNSCGHFIDCVLQRRQPLTGGSEGLAVVSILEKADESMRKSGERISICR